MTKTVAEFFGEHGPLAEHFEGYETRPQQLEFSQSIEQAISERKVMVGEAPTGVGKSLAALVPVFQAIKKKGCIALVVTSSIILQEQYINKDIPLLEKLFKMNVNPVLIKGKNNYLCLHKAMQMQIGATNSYDAEEVHQLLEWSRQTKTGDISELDFEPKRKNWNQFSIAEEGECKGKDCPLFNQCHYYRERNRMQSAKLIVCNYHYLFTAMKSESLLPSNIEIVIMDEGHEISSIARNMTAESYHLNSYKNMNHNLIQAQRKIERSIGVENASIHNETGLIEMLDSHQQLMLALSKFFHEHKPKHKDKWRIEEAEKEALRNMSVEHISHVGRTLEEFHRYLHLKGLNQEYRDSWSDYYSEEEIEWQLAIESYARLLEKRYELALYVFGHIEEYPGDAEGSERIVWLEPMNENYVSIKTQSTQSAPITRDLFKEQPEERFYGTPIVISATLTAAQSFEHIKTDLGMEGEVIEKTVSTPFDLTSNMLWYLPEDALPGNDRGHITKCIDIMEEIILTLHGKTMCLFTSNFAMTTAAEHFKKTLPNDIKILVQGEIPKQKIISQMKENPNAIIVATRSFFTGVDIQGQNLSAVLIDKIPFPMAGEPVNEYLAEQPRGFWRHTLPETIITLKQGFGRLNRTSSDRGVVAVLDGRLATAGYKNRIFNSFDFKVQATRSIDQVKEYLEGILNDGNIQ